MSQIQTASSWISSSRVCIHVSRYCNLRCEYCLSNSGPEVLAPALDCEAIARSVEWLGVEGVTVSGGEPLLSKDLAVLLATLNRLDKVQNIKVTTNGTVRVSGHLVSALSRIGELNFSIDEPINSERSLRTYSGKQKRAILENISRVSGEVAVSLNVVVSRANRDEIATLVDQVLRVCPSLSCLYLLPLARLGRGVSISPSDFVADGELQGMAARLGRMFDPLRVCLLSFHRANLDYVVIDHSGCMTLMADSDALSVQLRRPGT